MVYGKWCDLGERGTKEGMSRYSGASVVSNRGVVDDGVFVGSCEVYVVCRFAADGCLQGF